MIFTKIYPLGPKPGFGTYETFYDSSKYQSLKQAKEYYDVVVVDFVKDEWGVIYFEVYSTMTPDIKKYHKLIVQQFPFGVDYNDDVEVCNLVAYVMKKKIPFNPRWN